MPCPKAEGAYQIVNFSNEPLRYLCFSAMDEHVRLVYPDSEKIGLLSGSQVVRKKRGPCTKYLRGNAEVSYYNGEE